MLLWHYWSTGTGVLGLWDIKCVNLRSQDAASIPPCVKTKEMGNRNRLSSSHSLLDLILVIFRHRSGSRLHSSFYKVNVHKKDRCIPNLLVADGRYPGVLGMASFQRVPWSFENRISFLFGHIYLKNSSSKNSYYSAFVNAFLPNPVLQLFSLRWVISLI